MKKDHLRKITAGLLAACIMLTAWPLAAEEMDTEDIEETLKLTGEEAWEAEGENTEDVVGEGKVYEEPTREDFDANSPAIYTGKIRKNSIYSEKDTKKPLIKDMGGKTVDILFVGLVWMIVRYQGKIGYVKREYVVMESVVPLDPANTAPFNVQKHQYIATIANECFVRKSMSKEPLVTEEYSTYWVKLHPGTRISIWKFVDGWAVVNYMRSYGYIDPNDLKDLIPVSPSEEPISKDSPIAAYTSYYKMNHLLPTTNKKNKELNLNRIWNIGKGAETITETCRMMMPGDTFDGNRKNIGPFRGRYKKAIGMVDGEAVESTGGGTCQVSSTLYNIIIQLPGLVIDYRRPHGGNGASYLPIHCDAAVGTENLNFRFHNGYDFPIRLEGHSSGDGALLMLAYRADVE